MHLGVGREGEGNKIKNELMDQIDLHLKKVMKCQEKFLKISEFIISLLNYNKNRNLKLCTLSALKRVISTIEGLKLLIENENFTCAAPLARVLLDNLIRLKAFNIAKRPEELARRVLSGERIRNLKDVNEKRMTDSYLVSLLSKEYNWISEVYNRTSGYIHFSFQHYHDMIVGHEEYDDKIKTVYFMSKDDSHVKKESYLEITTLIFEVSTALDKLIFELFKEELENFKK